MPSYNTSQMPLILPEYGRNIQKMIDHCKTLEDRQQRNQCALTIIKSMGVLFPELLSKENEHKLWDHLMIMSGFELDIDFPYPTVKKEDLQTSPNTVGYTQKPFRNRQYGKLIQQMIAEAIKLPQGEERNELIRLIANQMKKQMLAVNPDGVEDSKIFADIREISYGDINISADMISLNDYQQIIPVGKKRKRK